jgi:hypothetical protein
MIDEAEQSLSLSFDAKPDKELFPRHEVFHGHA